MSDKAFRIFYVLYCALYWFTLHNCITMHGTIKHNILFFRSLSIFGHLVSIFRISFPFVNALFNDPVNCWDPMASVIDEWMRTDAGGMILTGGKKMYSEKKPFQVPLFPPKIPLSWDWIMASAVGGWRPEPWLSFQVKIQTAAISQLIVRKQTGGPEYFVDELLFICTLILWAMSYIFILSTKILPKRISTL
jgi:hypothetical protein